MTSDHMDDNLCPEEELTELVDALQNGGGDGITRLSELLSRFQQDPRLHFLTGSMMAGRRDYAGAEAAMRRAVDLAPDFAIARFQLGFLQLTNGDGYKAQESWGPLHGLPTDHYLRLFAAGLSHLIRDEFREATTNLQRGIASNKENEPLNGDMMLILDEIARKGDIASAGGSGGEAQSSAQLLLQQASFKSSKH